MFSIFERIYGVEYGGDRKSRPNISDLKNNDNPKNQSELANTYGITKQTMSNYMRMANMIPELDDLVEATCFTMTLIIMK